MNDFENFFHNLFKMANEISRIMSALEGIGHIGERCQGALTSLSQVAIIRSAPNQYTAEIFSF